jgi:hypothetical protein
VVVVDVKAGARVVQDRADKVCLGRCIRGRVSLSCLRLSSREATCRWLEGSGTAPSPMNRSFPLSIVRICDRRRADVSEYSACGYLFW